MIRSFLSRNRPGSVRIAAVAIVGSGWVGDARTAFAQGVNDSPKPHACAGSINTFGYPRALEGVTDICIDGLSGNVSSRAQYGPGAAMRVVVTNVNPFLFKYTTEVTDETAIAEASPSTFFNIAFSGLGVKFPASKDSSVGNSGAANLATQVEKAFLPVEAKSAGCTAKETKEPDAERAYEQLSLALARNTETYNKGVSKAGSLLKAAGDVDEKVRPAFVTLRSANKNANEIRLATQGAYETLNAHAIELHKFVGDAQLAASNLAPAVAELSKTANKAVAEHPNCANFIQLTDKLAELNDRLTLASAALTALAKRRDEVSRVADGLAVIASDSSAFYSVTMLKPYQKPTLVTIRIRRSSSASTVEASLVAGGSGDAAPVPDRTPAPVGGNTNNGGSGGAGGGRAGSGGGSGTAATQPTITITIVPGGGGASTNPNTQQNPQPQSSPAAKDPVFATYVVHAGGRRRFTIGAGAMVVALTSPDFGIERRHIPLVPGTADTTAFVIRMTDTSSFRFIPAITLNALLVPFGSRQNDGIHASFGVGLHAQSDNTGLDYFLGAGPSLFSSRMLILAGAYIGKRLELDGLVPGAVVSTTSVSDYTSTRTVVRFGATLSYRVF
jgi:hypothetical protein